MKRSNVSHQINLNNRQKLDSDQVQTAQMKRFPKGFLCILVALCITTFMGVPFVSAQTEESFEYYILDHQAYLTKCISPVEGHLDIPATLGGAPVVYIGYEAFMGCRNLTSVTIPQSVTTLVGGAFANTGLTSITISKNVTRIDGRVFSDCPSLTAITVDEDNPNYTSIDGVLFTKDLTDLKQYPSGKIDAVYTVPQGVQSIHFYSFSSNPYLQEVVFSDTVTTVGEIAFVACVRLTDVTILPGVTNIERLAMGGTYDEVDWVPTPGFTVHGYVGTYAETYALSKKFEFVILNDKGDNNHDNTVDAKDALVALQIAVNQIDATPGQLQVSDVNDDTLVNAKDALEILKKSVGKPACF